MTYKTPNSYLPLNDQQSEYYLAGFLPKGKLFARKYDSSSNLYKLLWCVAEFIKQITAQIYVLFYNRNPAISVELLPNWETSVGIPAVIPRLTTIAQRQAAVVQLLSKIPVINIQPYATGNVSYNNVTGLVTVSITSNLILTNQTSVTVTGCTNTALNGTFNITIVNSTTFTYMIGTGTGTGVIVTGSGMVIQTSGGGVLTTGITPDSGRFAFNFSFDKRTIIENFVYNLTGITIHIYFYSQQTNVFPMTFPIYFGVTYNQSLLLFQVLVVGTSLPQSTINTLNTVLGRVIPSFCVWQFSLINS